MCQEGSNGIRDRDIKEQLRLRKERTAISGIRGWSRKQQLQLESMGYVNNTFRETLGLEITENSQDYGNECQDIVEESAPSEMKKESTNNVGAI